MSLEALKWALKLAPDVSGREQVVLIGLSDHADADGMASFPSQETLAGYAGCSIRTVARAIESLEAKGLIERGDQRLARGYGSGNRPPIVWNLRLDRVRERSSKPSAPPKHDSDDMSPATKPAIGDIDAGDQTSHPRRPNMTLVTANDVTDVRVTVPNRPEVREARSSASGGLNEGWKLVQEMVGPEYPSQVRNALARSVSRLLDEGAARDEVRGGLEIWLTRQNAGPGLLPHLVGDYVKARTAPPRKSTSDERREQAQSLKRPEWNDYDPAEEPPAVGLAAKKAITA